MSHPLIQQSCTSPIRLPAVPNIVSKNSIGGRESLKLCVLAKGASVVISLIKTKEALLTEKESLCSYTLFPRFRRGRRRSA